MSALASSQVTDYPTDLSRTEYPFGKGNRGIVRRQVKITNLAQGDATDTMGAAAFGLATITEASTLWDATNSKGYPAVIDPVNNIIILLDGSAAPAPVKVTAAATYITVTGTPTAPVN